MPYIGKTPTVGNFQVCDAISVVNGQAAYTLQVGGVNVAPESANHMLVSLNGILQKPGSSFTISGSTMTFASNLATGDVIDFVQILGNVLDIGQPSDDTVKTASIQANAVTGAKLNTDVISAQTALTDAPASTDELLISDGGVLKRIDVSLIGGIQMADQWRLASNHSVGTSASVITGWERPDDTESSLSTYGRIGTGMSESSGTFTFPSTGIYLVRIFASSSTNSQSAVYVQIQMSKDGTNYDVIGDATHYIENGFVGYTVSEYLADVTNTSNDLIQFTGRSSSGTNTVTGNTNQNTTSVTFIRLGDT